MATLSTKARTALPSKSFALPGKGEGPKGKGSGSYPIPDASHARNALARVSQHGTAAEKATVRAKVHAKFPGIGEGKGGGGVARRVGDRREDPASTGEFGGGRGGAVRFGGKQAPPFGKGGPAGKGKR